MITAEFLKTRPLSYSSLKYFNESPKHYIHYLTKPKEPPTDNQKLGTLIELMIFDEEKIPKKINFHDKIDRRTKAGKEEWESLLNNNDGRLLVPSSFIEIAEKCKESVMNNEKIKPYIDSITRTQIKLEWNEKKYNVPLIGYVDFQGEIDGNMFIGDFKTTQDCSEEGFSKEIYKWKYYLQDAVYLLGYHKKFYKFPDYYYITVETSEPYNSNIFHCDSDYVNQCRAEIEFLLQSFKYCMDNDQFDLGYEFWLFDTMPYFNLRLPGYAKLKSK